MAEAKTIRLKEKIEGLQRQMQSLREIGKQVEAAPDKQVSLTDPVPARWRPAVRALGIVGDNMRRNDKRNGGRAWRLLKQSVPDWPRSGGLFSQPLPLARRRQ